MREKCPYLKFLWSVFSCIRTLYGEILRISKYSVQMQENTDQKNSDSGHFYTQCCVFITLKRSLNFKKTSKLRTLSLRKNFPYITELWCVLISKLEIWLESRLTCRWTPPKNTLFNPKFPFSWLLNTGAKPHFFKTTWLIIRNQNTAVAEQKEEKKISDYNNHNYYYLLTLPVPCISESCIEIKI